MTNQTNYSDEEWFLLRSLPSMMGSAIAVAAKSGAIGTAKEMMASVRAVTAGAQTYPHNELINAIISMPEDKQEARATAEEYRDRAESRLKDGGVKTPEALAEAAMDDARAAIVILERESSAGEAAEYLQWAYDTCKEVAEAAKEGGFLGIGGERVSEKEEELLAQFARALDVEA